MRTFSIAMSILTAALSLFAVGLVIVQGSAVQGMSVAVAPPLPQRAPLTLSNTQQMVVASQGEVIAEAIVLPVQRAALGMATGGTVKAILIAEGDNVTAGQSLIQLVNDRLVANVAQARAGLRIAEANLEQLKAGARPQEIASMQAALDAARFQYARLTEGARPADETAALAALSATQATLQDVLDGPNEELLIEARAQLANAEAALQQAQRAYDKVKWSADIGMLPESLQLQETTNNYIAAKAHYDERARGADSAEIANAQAQVDQATAQLERLRKPARNSEIAAAAAEVRRLEAQLDLVQAGTRAELILAAEAEVVAAQATLLQMQAALAETVLKAPFAGTVAALDIRLGEQVAPGIPILQLGDFSAWQIETDDLSEVDILKVQENSPVAITFDGIPALEMRGKVTRIKSFGEDKSGDLTYTVVIQPNQLDKRLRWNMNAKVVINPP